MSVNVLAFTETFAAYAELWREIAAEAYSYGLHGLYDVGMLFHAAVLDAGQQEQGLDQNHGLLLEEWQELFMVYLDSPGMESSRNDLVRHLQEPLWANPLSDDDVDVLKGMLSPEAAEFIVEDQAVAGDTPPDTAEPATRIDPEKPSSGADDTRFLHGTSCVLAPVADSPGQGPS